MTTTIKLEPGSTIFKNNDATNIYDYINTIRSHKPTGGNIKFFFEKNEDIQFYNQFSKIRSIRDESTKFFVKTFLTGDLLPKFVMYMYQELYYKILANLNTELCMQYDKGIDHLKALPLQPNERVYLYFKGGTTMKFIYDEYKSGISRAKQAELVDIDNRFEASDTDLGIEIVCENNRRFVILKNAVSSIMTQCMDNIGKNFDFLLNNNTITEQTTLEEWISICMGDGSFSSRNPEAGYQNPPDINFSTNNDYNISEIMDFCRSAKYNIYINDFNSDILLEFLKKHNLLDNQNGLLSCPTNPAICGLYIELIDYFINMVASPPDTFLNLRAYLIKGANYKVFELYASIYKMYTQEKKNIFLNNLQTSLNGPDFVEFQSELKSIYYETFSKGDNIYKRNVEVQVPRPEFAQRNDFIVEANDDPYFTTKITNFTGSNKNHYISINNSILDESADMKLDFNLFRVKLCIKLDLNGSPAFTRITKLVSNPADIEYTTPVDELLIPSEILDVSITNKHDNGHHHIINAKNPLDVRSFNINRDIYSLFIYSINNHINDLSVVLFKQSGGIPWLDSKYNKRIDRLVFFILKNLRNADLQDRRDFKILLRAFIRFKNQVTKNDKIFTCHPQFIRRLIHDILPFVRNSNDSNYNVIKNKYNNDNLCFNIFESYDLRFMPNTLELLINNIIIWGNIISADDRTPVDNRLTGNRISIPSGIHQKARLIKKIYLASGRNINSLDSLTTFTKISQSYLEFLHVLGSRIELLLNII